MKILTTDGNLILEIEESLAGRDLSGVNLERADLDGAQLSGINLTGAVLISASLDTADLANAILERANLEGAICSDACFECANLDYVDLYWAQCYKANFRRASLKHVDFRGADLKYADFTEADLRNANFGKDNLGGPTDLRGAILKDSIVDEAIFSGALYDSRTILPVGFNPSKHQMVFHEVLET